jgi:hypothetical protein
MADRSGKEPSSAAADVEAEVVIVGDGIVGLATALALRRVGVGARSGVLVLERHAELRSTGTALIIFPNGWFAHRALGVAHKLASRYDAFETYVPSSCSSLQHRFDLESSFLALIFVLISCVSCIICRSRVTTLETGATQVLRFAARKSRLD